jgi:hypothetical protein
LVSLNKWLVCKSPKNTTRHRCSELQGVNETYKFCGTANVPPLFGKCGERHAQPGNIPREHRVPAMRNAGNSQLPLILIAGLGNCLF